jgi:hypothetical protein
MRGLIREIDGEMDDVVYLQGLAMCFCSRSISILKKRRRDWLRRTRPWDVSFSEQRVLNRIEK